MIRRQRSSRAPLWQICHLLICCPLSSPHPSTSTPTASAGWSEWHEESPEHLTHAYKIPPACFSGRRSNIPVINYYCCCFTSKKKTQRWFQGATVTRSLAVWCIHILTMLSPQIWVLFLHLFTKSLRSTHPVWQVLLGLSIYWKWDYWVGRFEK